MGQPSLVIPEGLAPTTINVVFPEFLQSVADAKILVRNGEMFSTADYIDSQTQSITLLVNTFSAEYGIASTISITAWFGPTVEVIWTVQHLQATEGEQLLAYESIISIGLALAGVIFVERVYSMETTL